MAAKKDPLLSEPLQGQGPGEHLRNAREQAGMSVDTVAAALLLNPQTLELIEADAHDRLPAPTFVRGYLRGYARVLGIPSGPILDMYDRQGFEHPPLTNDVTEATQAHTSDTPVRLVTYAVAVVLALLVGLWWHSQEDGGFGIGGDLFDWWPYAGQDSSLLTADESGPSPDQEDTGEESVAMAADPADDQPLDDESTGRPHVVEAETGDPSSVPAETTPAGTEPEGAPVATASIQPDTTPGDGESSPAPPVGAAPPGESTAAGAVPAGAGSVGAPVATASLQPATPGDGESSPTPPAGGASPGESAAAEAVPAGTGPESAPAATASPRPDTVPEGGESAPGAADGVASATREAQPEAVAGTDSGGADGDDTSIPERSGDAAPADDRAGASLAEAPAPETEGAAPGTRAGSTAAAGTARPGLVLEFVHESWVEVYDRERVRLFFNLVQPGTILDFDGPRPFDVLLGFGRDVRVTIDGQAFDHTPYLRHGVARFSVGSESPDGTSVAESSQ